MTIDPVAAVLTRLAREGSGRVIALLARRFDDLDLADDAVQEALIEAAEVWPIHGVPTNPAAWLLTVARRKALDRLRRAASARRRTLAAAPELLLDDESGTEVSEPMIEWSPSEAGLAADEQLGSCSCAAIRRSIAMRRSR